MNQNSILDIYKNITSEEKFQIDPKMIPKNQLCDQLILPLIKSNAELNKILEDLNCPATSESLQIKLKKVKKFKNKRDYLFTEGIFN